MCDKTIGGKKDHWLAEVGGWRGGMTSWSTADF